MTHISLRSILFFAALAIISCGSGESGGGTNNAASSNVSSSYWAASYGGPGDDGAFFSVMQETSDGGYIIAGDTYSFGSGKRDIWVIKLNSDNSIAWQKAYGGGSSDGVSFIQETNGGGYIVAGNTESFGPAGLNNTWVLKLKTDGGIEWQKAYGSSGSDICSFIDQTGDGGYVIAGSTNSSGAGNNDFWVIKLDSDGVIEWQNTYGGPANDEAYSVKQTNDDGYIVTGLTKSFGTAGSNDIWILKLDSTGAVVWRKAIGGTGSDFAGHVQQTTDNGYIIAGQIGSSSDTDLWILKLNSAGGPDWSRTYSGSGDEKASFVQQTNDGGYIVTGQTDSFGAGNNDYWVLKLRTDGSIEWEKTYGGPENDSSYYIQQTSDNGYAVAGQSQSFGAGMRDIWLLNLKSDGTVSTTAPSTIGADTSAAWGYGPTLTTNTLITTIPSTATTVKTSIAGVDTSATVRTQASE